MPRAGLTTERLVQAGAELADEIGFERATLSELARRLDVKVASLYAHVRNSRDLRTGIAVLALGELADRAGDALAGQAGQDALVAFADAYRDYARAHPGRYAAIQLDLDAEAAERAVPAGRRHTRLAEAVLRGYDLPEAEHPHAVRLLGSVVHGYLTLEANGRFDHSDPGSQRSWERALDAVDALLRHWPS